MKTKIETIAKAYGEHWETVKDYVDENGWIDFGIFGYNEKTKLSIASVGDIHRLCGGFENTQNKGLKVYPWKSFHRPKSLAGIETNNGWIKIESEADLPKEEGLYFTMRRDKTKIEITHFFFDYAKEFKRLATHYQPIVKPEPPIY